MRFRRPQTGETLGARSVRITYRCLFIDLHLDLPPADMDIGAIDHPILRKAREFAGSYPQNTIRIQQIQDAMVYRFTHGRDRVATWLDEERGILWVCAVDERDEDTYDFFVGLHADGELLPGSDDALREEVEAAARFANAVRRDVPLWLTEAREHAGTQRVHELPGGAKLRLYIQSGNPEAVWIALPTLTGPSGLTPRMRALVIAVAQEQLPDGEWEQRYDWPTGQLPSHEIAYLGLR
jgi:hypothetical protein